MHLSFSTPDRSACTCLDSRLVSSCRWMTVATQSGWIRLLTRTSKSTRLISSQWLRVWKGSFNRRGRPTTSSGISCWRAGGRQRSRSDRSLLRMHVDFRSFTQTMFSIFFGKKNVFLRLYFTIRNYSAVQSSFV